MTESQEEALAVTRIVLVGFMGAGKSTLGALLASTLGWRFVDSDEVLVQDQGRSIRLLFEQIGEAAFRELEAATILQALVERQTVLALGGGAFESAVTRRALLAAPETHVVFLETPLEVAIARCEQQQNGAVRPVLTERALLAERFARRAEQYRESHTTLATEGRSPAELLRLLLDTLEPRLGRSRP